MDQKREIDFNPQKLQAIAEKLSQHFWGQPIGIPVEWNGRLTRSMGRFVYRVKGKQREPLKIEMSKHAAQFIDREIFIAVLLHELCHFHLFCKGQPYHDHHPHFERELLRVGAISTNTVRLPEKVFQLHCTKCGQNLGMVKRMNPDRYRSTCCQAKIKKVEKWVGEFQYDGSILKNSKVRIHPGEKRTLF